MTKIAIVLGTRPEIIKMSPVIRACADAGVEFDVIHTNQHYSDNMDKIFFEELELPQPAYNLNIGSGKHGEMTGRMMIALEEVFEKEGYDVVLVQGDTNTVMAGALVASKMGIRVGHVEAGLRSYDRTMPEELNRIVTDHISDYLFSPTEKQSGILRDEGIKTENIFTVGNTVVDAVHEGVKIAERRSDVLQRLGLENESFILMTSHRPATVDNEPNLRAVLTAVEEIADNNDKRIIFPSHPRTKKMIEYFGIELGDKVEIIEPVGYLDMLVLQKKSFLIVTDSGGIQEESCILEKKTVIIRDNTERPEAVDVGGCILAGNKDAKYIANKADDLIKRAVDWYNPFGNGTSGSTILNIIANKD